MLNGVKENGFFKFSLVGLGKKRNQKWRQRCQLQPKRFLIRSLIMEEIQMASYTKTRGEGACSTYNDEQNEVDEVVEGVSIHNIIHDLHPTLQSDDLEKRK